MGGDLTPYREALRANRDSLVIVTGAGVSLHATHGHELASWLGLLRNGLQRIVASNNTPLPPRWLERQEEALRSGDMDDVLSVATQVQQKLSRNRDFEPWLRATIGQLEVMDDCLIRTIAAIGVPIATTNYDSLQETVTHYAPIVFQPGESIGLPRRGEILHLHGHWRTARSIVFDPQSYGQHLYDELVQAVMYALRAKTPLFIGMGAGLADPDFSTLFHWSRRVLHTSVPKAYRLVADEELERARAMHPNENIALIPYGAHDQLLGVIEALFETATAAVLTSPVRLTSDPHALRDYLAEVIRAHRTIEVRGLRHGQPLSLELAAVYVDLRLDATHPFERARLNHILALSLQRALNSGLLLPPGLLRALRAARGRDVAHLPITMADLEEAFAAGLIDTRDVLEIEAQIDEFVRGIHAQVESWVAVEAQPGFALTLAQAYQRHRHLVILGHPGAGKTTIGKWLALKMATALRDGRETVVVRGSEVTSAAEVDGQDVVLGRTRLPVLVPAWEYARYVHDHPAEMNLIAYLRERHPAAAGEIADHYGRGQLLLILDGVDEIATVEDRNRVIEEIHRFLDHSDRDSARANPGIIDLAIPDGGNRVVITSRIAGNYSSRLRAELPRLTIEPMSSAAVEEFMTAWMTAVVTPLAAGADPAQVRSRVKANVEALVGAIRTNPALAGLATNPQLAGVLATIFMRRRGTMPHRRIEVYRQAVENLIETWEARLNRDGGMSRHEILYVLEPIAAHMQATSAPISDRILRELTVKHLREQRLIGSKHDEVALLAAADNFMAALRTDVGLLSAFAEGEYRFLHRSFQEYLAGRYLVRDRDTAAERILEKMDDTLWREPIVLAFGHLSIERPLEVAPFVEQILAQSRRFDDLIPRTALLLADVLSEMDMTDVQQANEIAQRALERLFAAYADRAGLARFEEMRVLLAKAFNAIRQGSYERVAESLLAEKLGEPGFSPAAADLVSRLELFTPRFVDALRDALAYDSADWSWPVIRALRQALAPVADLNVPKASPSLATHQLELRFELELAPDLVERLSAQPTVLRAVIAVYGGLADLRVADSLVEYYKIATYLQLPDHERRSFEMFFGERWGFDDPVYNMAVYLDTFKPKRLWKLPPRFEPRFIYRDSPLTDLILPAVTRARSTDDLVAELRRLAELTATEDDEWVDAVVALAALGEDVRDVLRDALATHARSRAAARVLDRLEQLAADLTDSIVRAGQTFLPELSALGAKIQSGAVSIEEGRELLAATLDTLVSHGAFPQNTLEVLQSFPEELHPMLLSESFSYNFAGSGDDAVNSADLALDVSTSLGIAPDILVSAMMETASARQAAWPIYSFGWPVEGFPSRDVGAGDIPEAVLTAIETVHSEISMMRSWALVTILGPVIGRNPSLLPVVLAVCLGDMGSRSDRRETLGALAPELLLCRHPQEEVLRLAQDVEAPYYRARALVRLLRHLPDRECELFTEAIRATNAIEDPGQREQVAELLLLNIPVAIARSDDVDLDAIVEGALAAAVAIGDADAQARAFARLSFHVPHSRRISILRQALAALGRVESEDVRVATLGLFEPVVAVFPELAEEFRALVGALSSARRDVAQRRYGAVLHRHEWSLFSLTDASTVLWTPVILAASIRDLRREFGGVADVASLWGALAAGDDPRAEERLLEAGAKGLRFTRFAALAIDRMISAGRRDAAVRVLAQVARPEPETRGVLLRWLHSTERVVRDIAQLLLAEFRGLSSDLVPGVMACLRSDDDNLRNRAARVIHHPGIETEEEPTRRVSVIGRGTIDALFSELAYTRAEPEVAVRLRWLSHDLFHDSPDDVLAWCAALDGGGTQAVSAKEALESIEAVTEEVWETMLTELPVASPSVKEALLLSVARLAKQSKRFDDARWSRFLEIVPHLRTTPLPDRKFLKLRLADLVQALIPFLDAHVTATPQILLEAGREFIDRELTYDFAAMLEGWTGEALRAEMAALMSRQFYAMRDLVEATRAASAPLKERPELLRPLAAWLIALLEETVVDDWLRHDILVITAAAAADRPLTFVDLFLSDDSGGLDIDRMEFLLVRAARRHNTYPGRAAALRLLGSLRRATAPVIETIHAAMTDVSDVQDAALVAVVSLKEVSPDITSSLVRGLNHASALAAYATARLLARAGSTEGWSRAARQKVLQALGEAIRDPRSQRYVHFNYVDATVPNMPRLDQIFYKGLIEIAGLR